VSTVLDFLPTLLEGAVVTLKVTAGAALLGLVCAFASGMAGMSGNRLVRGVARVYVEIFRGTSALVQLFWLYFVLPQWGFRVDAMTAGILALGLNIGSYGAEVVRGSIKAVPRAQYEATVALNMSSYQRMRRVILPQAVVSMLPPFGNLLIELLKGTSLVSLITLSDLTFRAQILRASTGRTATIFLMVLVMYFVMAYAITLGMKVLERRAAASIGLRKIPSTGPRIKVPASPAG
jgi:polar amino acid transport system permease protein